MQKELTAKRCFSPADLLAGLFVVYLAVFGFILITARGIPYTIDNNETFSTLWHARHLYDVSFGKTKGLADEVFSWDPQASPYVHSHQGNFPRLFAFLLYLLGSRSIESQTAIITLVVGFGAIYLAFQFLRTLGPPKFAALGCLVLISDYGLVGQWQVNTHRVWTEVFFFAGLFWMRKAGEYGGKRFLFLGVAIFAIIFYGENVFAVFTGLLVLSWGIASNLKHMRTAIRIAVAVVGGGCIAGIVLVTQLVAYMGWSGLKLDIRYATAARNMASDQLFTEKVDRFYALHHVIFWHNYYDVSDKRSVTAFLHALVHQHFQFYTPWLTVAVALILLSTYLARCCHNDEDIAAAVPLELSFPKQPLKWIAGSILFFFFWVAVLRVLPAAFDQFSDDLFRQTFGISISTWIPAAFYGIVLLFGLVLCVFGSVFSAIRQLKAKHLALMSLCVIFAFGATYRIFTGYVLSSYLDRGAPILAYWTDVLLAAAIYVTTAAAIHTVHDLRESRLAPVVGLISASAAVGCLTFWLLAQSAYILIAPPTGEPFLHILSKRPYVGRTFAVNGYPAQVAEETHAWAHDDSSIFSGRLSLNSNGYRVEYDPKYLWFADATTNTSYSMPDYGLMLRQPANLRQALLFYHAKVSNLARPDSLGSIGLLQRVREPLQPFLIDHLTSEDLESYAIVKFDWDFPSYLKPVLSASQVAASGTLDDRIAFSRTAFLQRRRWHVQIAPLPNYNGDKSPHWLRLTDLSAGALPLVDPRLMLEAGWRRFSDRYEYWTSATPDTPKRDGRIDVVGIGDQLAIHFATGPQAGRAFVRVNDVEQSVDLESSEPGSKDIDLDFNRPYGQYTSIPSAPPGYYVNTWITSDDKGPALVVGYRYAHQDGAQEAQTAIRLYLESETGKWQLADEILFLGADGLPVRTPLFRYTNPDTVREFERVQRSGDRRTYEQWLSAFLIGNPREQKRTGILDSQWAHPNFSPTAAFGDERFLRIPAPNLLSGRIQLSVTPGTTTKTGPEYFGSTFDSGRLHSIGNGEIESITPQLPKDSNPAVYPYGMLALKIRFPNDQTLQAEPIIATGAQSAGDFVYVIYPDSAHIRLGFDHWFRGGVLTPPIPIDYGADHDLQISMGSLYPSEDDVVFLGVDPAKVASIKHRLTVKLDGRIVIDSAADFWDTSPSQVEIGLNKINGTTSNKRFTGQIFKCTRVWPDLN